MTSTRFLLVAASAMLVAPLTMRAADLKVIANPSVSAGSISAEDLKDVFLENRDSLGGSHVDPVLEKGGPAHEAFLKVMGKSESALETYYRSLVFSGKGAMPKTLGSDAEVAAFVAKTKGAVGYVSADASAPGTKTLDVK
jgi:hypothetical protein